VLRASSNYREFFGEINYETGNAILATGDVPGAIEHFRYVDTSYARTESDARALLQLGQIYETRLFQLDSARNAYQKGRGITTTVPLLQTTLSQRADYLGRYVGYRADLLRLDTLRLRALQPKDSLAAGDSAGVKRDISTAALALSLDSITARTAQTKLELASLFHTTMGLPDSAKVWYGAILRDHPSSPVVPRVLYGLAQIASSDTTRRTAEPDSLYRLLIAKYPRSEYAHEARRLLGLPDSGRIREGSEELYRKGEDFLVAGKPDEAIKVFRLIPGQFPLSSYAPQAYYAIGWVFEQVLVKPDSAVASYTRLLNSYPSSSYTRMIQSKLAEVQLFKKGIKTDSTATNVKPKLDVDAAEEAALQQRKAALPPKAPRPAEEPEKMR
jgi:tetratricopeptide (TPR) repeat protein